MSNRRPSMIELIVTAVIATLAGYLTWVAGSIVFNSYFLLKLALASSLFAYLVIVMRSSGKKQGKALLGAALVLLLFVGDLLSLEVFALFLLLTLWIIRSSLSYRSMISTILDGALVGLAALLSLAVLNYSGSVSKTVWVFFLAQSLSVFIPHSFSKKGETFIGSAKSDFDLALSSANKALREMARA